MRLLMLDSGAFSVWARGQSVDLAAYLKFCTKYPEVSYYVSLDVIPGRFRVRSSIWKPGDIESACKQGWLNYKSMLQELPKHKLIPVYHQHEPVEWLERYLEFGCPYIGISPANDSPMRGKIGWLASLRKILFDGAGRPTVKTHGFAVTSYDLLQYWQWHSVDSASWQHTASMGGIYLPIKTGSDFDFGKPPLIVATTPMSSKIGKEQRHLEALSPMLKDQLQEWLDYCKVRIGKYRILRVKQNRKLNKKAGEIWHSRERSEVMQPTESGIVCSQGQRLKVNLKFIKLANRALPVDHIYFAGVPRVKSYVEYALNKRLISYEWLRGGGTTENRHFLKHIQMLEDYRANKP